MQQEERGPDWLLQVLGMGSELSFVVAKMCQITVSLQTLKSITFLNNLLGYMLVFSVIPQIPSALCFPLKGTESRNIPHKVS